MQHFIQSYLGRVFVAEHNHPQRIADQDNVEAAFIEQTRGWIIVGSQRRDALAASLHFTKFFCRVHSCEIVEGRAPAGEPRRGRNSTLQFKLPFVGQTRYFSRVGQSRE